MLFKCELLLTLQTRLKVMRTPLGLKWTISTWLGVGHYTYYGFYLFIYLAQAHQLKGFVTSCYPCLIAWKVKENLSKKQKILEFLYVEEPIEKQK